MKAETLNFTKSQYITLLRLVYLGKWFKDSYKNEPDIVAEEIEQMIFSLAPKFKLSELISFDNKMNRFFPSRKLEAQIHELVDDYDDYTFWDELMHRLGKRDFVEKYGEEIISKMDVKQRLKHEQPFIEKYESEFEKNGIDKLVLN